MSSLPPPTPGQQPGWSYPVQQPLRAQPQTNTALALGLIACAGALLLLLGSFLPWVTVRSIFGSFSVNGLDGDGMITAGAGALALILLILGTTTRTKVLFVLGAIASGIGAAVAVYDIINVSNEISGSGLDGAVRAEVGIGLYLCAIGGVVGLVCGFVAMGNTPGPPVRVPPFAPPDAFR